MNPITPPTRRHFLKASGVSIALPFLESLDAATTDPGASVFGWSGSVRQDKGEMREAKEWLLTGAAIFGRRLCSRITRP